MRKIPLKDDVAKSVLDCLYSAMRYRCGLGIDARIISGEKLREGEYSCDEIAAYGDLAPYLNIVEVKCHDFEAAFSDVQFSIAAKPFVIKPTSKPTISRKAKREAAISVFNSVQALMQEKGGRIEKSDLLKIMLEKKSTLVREIRAASDKGTKELQRRVYDKFEESNWQQAYAEFIQDLATHPVGYIKGPVAVHQEKRQWIGRSVVKIQEPTIQFYRLDPKFVFPSPGARDTQECDYIIEVAPVTIKGLAQLMLDESARKPALKSIIDDYYSESPCESFQWYALDSQIGKIPDSIFSQIATAKSTPSDQTYIVKYYGGMLGIQLKSLGIKKVESYEYYESEIWVIGNKIIKAIVKDGVKRPIHSSSFRLKAGSIYGKSVADLLEDVQKSINGFHRANHKNAEWVSDPLKEVFDKAFPAGEEPDDVFPGDTIHPKTSPYQGADTPAVRLTYGKSALTELFNMLMGLYRLADELVGIQSQITGSADMASVNRTASVYVASANNALKKIKLVGRNIDIRVIIPVVESMIDLEMINNPAGLYRADVNAVPSGSSGIVEKEVISSQIGIILQTITSMVPMDDPDNPRAKELFYAVFRQFLESHGFDAGPLLPDMNEPDARGGKQSTPGTPAQQLDGRSVIPEATTIPPQLEAA